MNTGYIAFLTTNPFLPFHLPTAWPRSPSLCAFPSRLAVLSHLISWALLLSFLTSPASNHKRVLRATTQWTVWWFNAGLVKMERRSAQLMRCESTARREGKHMLPVSEDVLLKLTSARLWEGGGVEERVGFISIRITWTDDRCDERTWLCWSSRVWCGCRPYSLDWLQKITITVKRNLRNRKFCKIETIRK